VGTTRYEKITAQLGTGDKWSVLFKRYVILSRPEERKHTGAMEVTLFMFLKKRQLSFLRKTKVSL
jgi:hypothetical protein